MPVARHRKQERGGRRRRLLVPAAGSMMKEKKFVFFSRPFIGELDKKLRGEYDEEKERSFLRYLNEKF